MGYLLIVALIGLVVYVFNTSVMVISENDRAIVERLGTFKRILKPGVRFVIPLVEKVVYVDTLRERFLDIKPQEMITQDGLTLLVDAVVYWKIKGKDKDKDKDKDEDKNEGEDEDENIKKAYYAIENIEEAFVSIVLTTMRSEISLLKAKDISSSKKELDKNLLKNLDEATSNWGVKVIRVEVQNITFPERIQRAMENEWAAISEKEARIAIAEADKVAAIARAEADKFRAIAEAEAESKTIELLSKSLGLNAQSPDFLQYLVATKFVESNQKLGESSNSKILFVDPSFMSDSVRRLLGKRADFPKDDNNEPEGQGNGKKPLL
jgi:regulator of protease activity HflC (stomatin/prohibitin superfamily)